MQFTPPPEIVFYFFSALGDMFADSSFIYLEGSVPKAFLGTIASAFTKELRVYAFAVPPNCRFMATALLEAAVLYANKNKFTKISCPASKEYAFCQKSLSFLSGRLKKPLIKTEKLYILNLSCQKSVRHLHKN